ncbi:52 kDa repressor of the inhibitor of the protein kinase-like [Sipha flava]|uniref:52 kDa repressor of the inhibitor of the protein kinase-like n=1 Tax=Sipha flava TaxID=143950 RepID=A0A8B8GSV4_9HEMI|nr:52 kDa repressor of the inhibitor of the protein kinase-like [Sipha flava]
MSQLQIWKQKLKGLVTNNDEILPSNALDAIKHCDPIIFPNIFMLLKILYCLPVSTSTPERSFSGLKIIKTYLRNNMKEDRLNGLVLLSYYRNIIITPNEILNEMAKKPRKIDLVL